MVVTMINHPENKLVFFMEKTSTDSRDKKLDILAGYQMLGGLIGLVFMGYLFFTPDELSLFYVLLLLLGILLYLFSFLSGLFLLQRKTSGLKLSMVNQLLQVIGFSFWGMRLSMSPVFLSIFLSVMMMASMLGQTLAYLTGIF